MNEDDEREHVEVPEDFDAPDDVEVSEDAEGLDGEASTASKPTTLIVAAIAAIAVVLAAVLFLGGSGPGLDGTYGPTDAAPLTIHYPKGWIVDDKSPGGVTISPIDLSSASALTVATKTPERFRVVSITGVDAAAGYSASAIKVQGGALISQEQVEIGGRNIRRVEATFPASGGVPGTHVAIYLVDLGLGRVLPIAFISTEEGWDADLFRAIAESIEFDDAKLKAAADAFQAVPSPAPTSAGAGQTSPSAANEVQVSGGSRGPLEAGDEVPAFSAPGIDGGRVRWSAYAGEPVVLVVWAPWCPHCQKELPILGKVAPDFPGVRVVTVVTSIGSQPGPDAAELLRTSDLSVPTAVDTGDQTILKAFGVDGFPTTYYVKSDGTVMLMTSGETPEAKMRQLFRQVERA